MEKDTSGWTVHIHKKACENTESVPEPNIPYRHNCTYIFNCLSGLVWWKWRLAACLSSLSHSLNPKAISSQVNPHEAPDREERRAMCWNRQEDGEKEKLHWKTNEGEGEVCGGHVGGHALLSPSFLTGIHPPLARFSHLFLRWAKLCSSYCCMSSRCPPRITDKMFGERTLFFFCLFHASAA